MNAAAAADTLRDRLLAGLEAATVAAVKAADVERARPLAEAGAPDATGVLAALAHVAYFKPPPAPSPNGGDADAPG